MDYLLEIEYSELDNSVAIIWMDQTGEKVNKVSPTLLDAFLPVLESLNENQNVKAIILASRKKDFIAGADIDAFLEMGPGEAASVATKGHVLLSLIASSSKPYVAAIHGAAMGAGLEIALACSGRIASDSNKTALALPEVKLGLLPGGGGTQRLPRLVGIQNALNMMLTGRSVYSQEALKMGMVDHLVTEDELIPKAVQFAQSLTSDPLKRKPNISMFSRIIEFFPFTRNIIYQKALEKIEQKTNGNYPAPIKIIECVRIGMEEGMQVGIPKEIQEFDNLVQTPESRQLIQLFFAITDKKKNPYETDARKIENLGIVGSGKMGTGIAGISLFANLKTSLVDKDHAPLEKSVSILKKRVSRKIKQGAISREKGKRLLHDLAISTEYDILQFCQMVVESASENLTIKQKVLQEIEATCDPECILASNTSTIPIKELVSISKRPDQVIGMHYLSPVINMPLVEIVVTDQTADWVKGTAISLAIHQNKAFILVKDSPGFYLPRVLSAFLNETVLMIEEGIDPLFLDKTMKKFGFSSGPIDILDEVGLDYGTHIARSGLIDLFKKRGVVISKLLTEMAADGFQGKRNKKGFYFYHPKSGKKIEHTINPKIKAYVDSPTQRSFLAEEVIERLVLSMVNEAAMCLEEGVILSPGDGDLGAVFGLGFPAFRGGPFRYVDEMGLPLFLEKMEELENSHGTRFKAAAILIEKGKSGKQFY